SLLALRCQQGGVKCGVQSLLALRCQQGGCKVWGAQHAGSAESAGGCKGGSTACWLCGVSRG
ncbi:hypothetical protein NDU88_006290, partial [Pleurodeles waltl]